MKALIWIGCCFAYGVVTALFQAFGIRLGGIPTFALAILMFWLARTLCKKYDENKTQKKSNKNHIEENTEE